MRKYVMTRGLHFSIFLISLLAVQAKYRLCPNDGEPKQQADGTLVQCLPGQDSLDACGSGYSCFFSGFNYQCCPSNEEAVVLPLQDCPSSSVAVLDSQGYPIKCSTLGTYCPAKHMFCHEDAVSPFCCEHTGSVRNATKEANIPQEAEEFFKDDDASEDVPAVPIELIVECPENSLAILGGDGVGLTCSKDSPCPAGSFCHSASSAGVCCEGSAAAVEENEVSETSRTTTVATTAPTTPSTTKETPTTTAEASTTTEEAKPVRIHAVKTVGKDVQYKPNSFGGYTREKELPKEARQKKEFAQHYLLEQIKQGWPYDEKFYHPENIAVIRRGQDPTAIVHFN